MLSNAQVMELRKDFPALQQRHSSNRRPPIYLDNSCVTLTPRQVTSAILDYHHKYPGCGGHRSDHWFASMAQQRTAESRERLAALFSIPRAENATEPDAYPIIFTRNASEALNLVARTLGLMQGDTVLISDKEHNSNLCPWQEFERSGGGLTIVNVDPEGRLSADAVLDAVRSDRSIKLLSLHHCSNLDGVTTPLREIVAGVREIEAQQGRQIYVCVDGAQSAPHMVLNLGNPGERDHIDVDFFAASLHKMLGPSGVGFLYAKPQYLDCLNPFMVGGSTIVETSIYHRPVYADWPDRFEAGLQNYSGMHGAGAAATYLRPILGDVREHEQRLNEILTAAILPHLASGSLRIIGPVDPRSRGGITTFLAAAPPDSLRIRRFEEETNDWNIMYRTGQFCVDSWFSSHVDELPKSYKVYRFSMYFYNTEEEVERLGSLITRHLCS